MADFGGWAMPIEYAGGGVLAEHAAVRERVGVFDVSHLGKATVTGVGAAAFVDATLSNALGRIGPGQAQYTLCLDPGSAGVVDDLIVYLRSDDDVLLVPNAANTAEVVRRLVAEAPAGVSVTDRHEEFGVLAVQGPRSDEVLDRIGLPTGHPYMSFREVEWGARGVVVCRTGYTGERGYELLVPWAAALALWDALLEAGEPAGILPAGLGARDTLRTEMGYPLHGQDLSRSVTPNQAHLGWAVGWSKPTFWGREPLLDERAEGPRQTAIGLLLLERGVPRPHMTVHDLQGQPLGETTSGTFSPTLRTGIALALVRSSSERPAPAVDEELLVDVRGRRCRARVVRPPFVASHVQD